MERNSNQQTAAAVNAEALAAFLQGVRTIPEKADAPVPWAGAREIGPAAVAPLCELLGATETEVARNARRALYEIIHHSGRRGAEDQARMVQSALAAALKESGAGAQRQLAWMLSEIGRDDAIPAVAALLADKNAREDARCVLIRIPGKKAVAALQRAFESEPDQEFRLALADALRARGGKIKGYESKKTQPVRETSVTPPQTEPSR